MGKLNVTIEIHGKQIPVGKIEGNGVMDSSFCYDESYIARGDLKPLSISLPLQDEPFSPEQTRIFFEGLLPEGFTRRSVAQRLHVDEDDYLRLLNSLGKECIGAIRITDTAEIDDEYYEETGVDQIKELAAEGAAKSSELVINTHLSLAGASGKVGLYHDEDEDKWYLPHGLAPSTHIVKQSHVRLEGIVTNEQLSMLTARKCGITASESFIINVGSGNDSEILFASKRYDRRIGPDVQMVSGLKRQYRLHQEDFAQAMGIPAADKYEPKGKAYAKEMFDILRKYSADPLADQLQLWDRMIFSYILGNNDGHIKNYSLLYNEDMNALRLAPAYDIVCTTIYGESTREMSFNIGGAGRIDDVTKESFAGLAFEIGFGEKLALGRIEKIRDAFEAALRDSAKELQNSGFKKAVRMAEKILESRKGVI